MTFLKKNFFFFVIEFCRLSSASRRRRIPETGEGKKKTRYYRRVQCSALVLANDYFGRLNRTARRERGKRGKRERQTFRTLVLSRFKPEKYGRIVRRELGRGRGAPVETAS